MTYKFNNNILAKHNKNSNEILIINFDNNNDEVFVIKDIAIEFWNLIQQQKSENEIIDSIVKEYEVSKDQIKVDFKAFLKQLKDAKVLES